MDELPEFLREPHDPSDPSPWLALYLDQSVPIAEVAKRAWLSDLSSGTRQWLLPMVRPLARLTIVVFQLLKLVAPRFAASGLLHRMLEWNMRRLLSPNANLLIMRHFHLGSEILRFIADNTAHVELRTTPLKPRSLGEIREHIFVKHDVYLYDFIVNLNRQLRAAGAEFAPRAGPLDFSAISVEAPEIEALPRARSNVIDLETAIELYTPLYQLLLTDRDFWRASNSLQLDETIALYVARLLGDDAHVALANNKHPLVPLTTLKAGFRLVLHGLSTEMLHALLVRAKLRAGAAQAAPRQLAGPRPVGAS